ncbi:hypothetical protein [Neptunicella sp.]|uniref:hypothetical protein n=1 Tax=Neptunicella sp. TaxID=2125986 RepID=UPI003F68ECB8
MNKGKIVAQQNNLYLAVILLFGCWSCKLSVGEFADQPPQSFLSNGSAAPFMLNPYGMQADVNGYYIAVKPIRVVKHRSDIRNNVTRCASWSEVILWHDPDDYFQQFIDGITLFGFLFTSVYGYFFNLPVSDCYL